MNGETVFIQYYDSPCGKMVLASVGDELCLCDWSEMPCAERNMHRLARLMHASFKTESTSVLEQAMAQLNEYFAISIFIPCHRVIGTNRSLTGYAGGLPTKHALLSLENPPKP